MSYVELHCHSCFSLLDGAATPEALVERAHELGYPALALTAHASVPPEIDNVLRRACFDCHSNDTRWPCYSSIPPGSWLIAHDVDAGRGQLNFSRWGEYNPFDRADMLDKICDFATKRKMPLWPYRLLHRDARLSDADVAALCRWTDTEATRLVDGGS